MTPPRLPFAAWLILFLGLGPLTAAEDDGFRPIFDGKSLEGWEGDPVYWRVEDGCLVGEVTPGTVMKRNSHVIWRGGVVADFELKVTYRVSAQGNSGINYRSDEVPGVPFALRGYQADIDGDRAPSKSGSRFTGMVYEERARTFLARRGQAVRLDPGAKPLVIGEIAPDAELKAVIRNDEWNDYHLIARAGVLVHILNGRVMAVVVDDDPAERRLSGRIGVQVHTGPPMKIEYRSIRLKEVPAARNP